MKFKGSNSLYIGNLSVLVDRDSLVLMLKSIGQVLNVDVIISDNSRSRRCFAMVEMFSRKEADLVVEKLNGSVFQGRAITVKMKSIWPIHIEGGKNDQKKLV